ncbi:MAG: hypothetical protein RLY70_4640 [Planctomycetota bacterium]
MSPYYVAASNPAPAASHDALERYCKLPYLPFDSPKDDRRHKGIRSSLAAKASLLLGHSMSTTPTSLIE